MSQAQPNDLVAVPTLEEEDAKRPNRERESLVSERTRIINRMKSALARLGIRGFKPELRKAPQRLEGLRTPEDVTIPPNTLDEFRRDLARLALIREQIGMLEQARLQRLKQAPETGPHAIVRLLASIMGVGCAKRLSALNLPVVHRILWAWVLTVPAAAIVGYLVTQLFMLGS